MPELSSITRRARHVLQAMRDRPMVVLDIGGTTTRVARLEPLTGEHERVRRAPTPNYLTHAGMPPERIVELLARSIEREVTAELDGERADCIIVGYPGPVSSCGVAVRSPTILGPDSTHRVDVAAMLAELWPDATVRVLNDLTCAGYSFVRAGHRNFCVLTVGSGIGNKIFLDGRPYVGEHGFGGEIGHVKVSPRARYAGGGSASRPRRRSPRAAARSGSRSSGRDGAPRTSAAQPWLTCGRTPRISCGASNSLQHSAALTSLPARSSKRRRSHSLRRWPTSISAAASCASSSPAALPARSAKSTGACSYACCASAHGSLVRIGTPWSSSARRSANTDCWVRVTWPRSFAMLSRALAAKPILKEQQAMAQRDSTWSRANAPRSSATSVSSAWESWVPRPRASPPKRAIACWAMTRTRPVRRKSARSCRSCRAKSPACRSCCRAPTSSSSPCARRPDRMERPSYDLWHLRFAHWQTCRRAIG